MNLGASSESMRRCMHEADRSISSSGGGGTDWHNCAPTKTRNQSIMWVKGVKPLGVMAELHYYSLGDLVYLLKNGKCGLVSLCTVCLLTYCLPRQKELSRHNWRKCRSIVAAAAAFYFTGKAMFFSANLHKSSGGGCCGAFAEIVVRCCDSIYRKYARRAAI
jgi:hypothetical protein